MTRTIKTVLISVPSIKGYSRHVYRVVDCQVGQHGYRNERGVKVLWESAPLYRATCKSPRSQGYAARQHAEQVRREALAQQLGLRAVEVV